MTHGASLVTTSTSSTTIPFSSCESMNCYGDCIRVNGDIYVRESDALAGLCEFFHPPACDVCADFCASTTTSTTSSTTTP